MCVRVDICISTYICVYMCQLCPTLCNPICYTVHGLLQARILEWWPFPSLGDLPNPEIKPGLPHCRRILHQLSHQGSPRILQWVTYPFSSRSSWPRNQSRVSFIAGRFFTNWAIREAPRHMYIYIHMSIYMWVCVCMCVYIYVYSISMYTCICMDICIYVCMCVNIYYCVVYTRNGRSEDNMAKCSHWLDLSGWWCQVECFLSFCMS